jgi:hypothetical protein
MGVDRADIALPPLRLWLDLPEVVDESGLEGLFTWREQLGLVLGRQN